MNRPGWWRPTWISLVGEQPLPNVLPVLAHAPENVVFVHSNWPLSRDVARRCAAFLKNRGIRAQTSETDAYDPDVISRDLSRLGDQLGYASLLLNWTGGTKPMAFAALNAMPRSVPTLYYDTREGTLVNLAPPYVQASHAEASPLTLEDHLVLNADVRVEHAAAGGTDRPATMQILCDGMRRSNAVLRALQTYRDRVLRRLRQKRGWAPVPATGIESPLPEDRFGAQSEEFMDAMGSDGLLHHRDPFQPSQEGLSFLDGLWFEHYIENRVEDGLTRLGLTGAVATIRRNVNIRWRNSRATNEIDVAFMNADRLYLISCTTAAVAEAHKRQVAVDELAERLGGRLARAMLATTLDPVSLQTVRERGRPTTLIPELDDWRRPHEVLQRWFGR